MQVSIRARVCRNLSCAAYMRACRRVDLCTNAANTHRLEVIKLGQRTLFSAALRTEDDATVPAMVLAHDDWKLAITSPALGHSSILFPLGRAVGAGGRLVQCAATLTCKGVSERAPTRHTAGDDTRHVTARIDATQSTRLHSTQYTLLEQTKKWLLVSFDNLHYKLSWSINIDWLI